MYVILYHTILIGVWLDPRSHHSEEKKVWIEGAEPEYVSTEESVSYDAENLALNLLSALFNFTVLVTGNCTQPNENGFHLLDQKKIHGTRRMFVYSSHQLHVFFSACMHLLLSFPPSVYVHNKFPLSSEEEEAREKTTVKDKLNVKCRGLSPKVAKKNKCSKLNSNISYDYY